MRREESRTIAQSKHIKWGEVQQTLKRAFDAGACNAERSRTNPSFSKARIYNMFVEWVKDFDPDQKVMDTRGSFSIPWIAAQRVIYEFSEYWEGWRVEKREPPPLPKVHHEEPIEPPF